jgi:hypothetical protein
LTSTVVILAPEELDQAQPGFGEITRGNRLGEASTQALVHPLQRGKHRVLFLLQRQRRRATQRRHEVEPLGERAAGDETVGRHTEPVHRALHDLVVDAERQREQQRPSLLRGDAIGSGVGRRLAVWVEDPLMP